MGAKIKTQKNILGFKQNTKNSLDQNLTPKKFHAEFPSHKNFERNYAAGIHGNYHIITPKKPYLNQVTITSTCHNFPTQKILKSKISNPKNPSIISVTWNPEYPLGSGYKEILPELRVFIPIKGVNGPYMQQHIRSRFLMPNSER